MALTHARSRALLFEHLTTNHAGQYENVAAGVTEFAKSQGLIGAEPTRQERDEVYELVRQHLWSFLVQGIIVFGKDRLMPDWPWYRLTPHGEAVVAGTGPQPYDPTGYLADFRAKNPCVDPVVFSYIDEAVRAFNHDCPKSAAVMVGAASEQAILLLHEALGTAISDAVKKAQYNKDSDDRWTIVNKYNVLKDRLDKMVATKNLTGDLRDTVSSELPGLFDHVRRQRNAAGHPEIVANVDPDSLFLTLRVMTEYIRRLQALSDHFAANPANW
jgi:hypothetical protein